MTAALSLTAWSSGRSRKDSSTPHSDRVRNTRRREGPCGLELPTSHYGGRNLAEKLAAVFPFYAHPEDASNLRGVLDNRKLTTYLLSLSPFPHITSNPSRNSVTPIGRPVFS